jgi:hypothetical protein
MEAWRDKVDTMYQQWTLLWAHIRQYVRPYVPLWAVGQWQLPSGCGGLCPVLLV